MLHQIGFQEDSISRSWLGSNHRLTRFWVLAIAVTTIVAFVIAPFDLFYRWHLPFTQWFIFPIGLSLFLLAPISLIGIGYLIYKFRPFAWGVAVFVPVWLVAVVFWFTKLPEYEIPKIATPLLFGLSFFTLIESWARELYSHIATCYLTFLLAVTYWMVNIMIQVALASI